MGPEIAGEPRERPGECEGGACHKCMINRGRNEVTVTPPRLETVVGDRVVWTLTGSNTGATARIELPHPDIVDPGRELIARIGRPIEVDVLKEGHFEYRVEARSAEYEPVSAMAVLIIGREP